MHLSWVGEAWTAGFWEILAIFPDVQASVVLRPDRLTPLRPQSSRLGPRHKAEQKGAYLSVSWIIHLYARVLCVCAESMHEPSCRASAALARKRGSDDRKKG
jgi:hypothetical protein